jgi:hypothetical protein
MWRVGGWLWKAANWKCLDKVLCRRRPDIPGTDRKGRLA